MNKNLSVVLILSSLVISGCGSNKIPLQSNNLDWQQADVMPSKQTPSSGKSKVIVRTPDVSQYPHLRQVELGDVFKRAISKYINKSGAIVIDRGIPARYKEELELYNIKENIQYSGPDVAQYLVDIKVNKATEHSIYLSGSSGVAPSCHITTKIKALAIVYKLPEIAQVAVVEIAGDAGGKSPARSKSCQYTYSIQKKLFTKAISRAAEDVDEELRNAFAPIAYISAVKRDDDDYYFKLSSGNNAGISPSALATVFTLKETHNVITNQTQLEEHSVAEVEILDKMGTNYAWFLVDDEDVALNIHIGDYVKVKYESSLLGDMTNGVFRGIEDYFLPPLE